MPRNPRHLSYSVVATAGALLLTSGAASAQTLFEGDSAYTHVSVSQEKKERCILFGKTNAHHETCIDLDDRSRHIFEYTATMFVGFLFQPAARDVALIGLGGAHIPYVFRHSLPNVHLQTVEIDPLVVRLAHDYFDFNEAPPISLAVDDGRRFLHRTKQQFDQIWLDAFNTDYIPEHMMTTEFFEVVKERLRPGGVVVSNLHNGNRLFDAQIATYRKVFPKVFVFTGTRSGNTIIVAGDATVHMSQTSPGTTDPQPPTIPGVDLRAEAAKLDGTVTSNGAPVLTDDYSPGNLLLHEK